MNVTFLNKKQIQPMNRRQWVWCVAGLLPLLVAGVWLNSYLTAASATTSVVPAAQDCCAPGEVCPDCLPVAKAEQGEKSAADFDCCLDPTCPPGCSPSCPPDCLDLTATAKTSDKASGKTVCPPCPFCP